MNEEWFRRMLIDAHSNQRQHLKHILSGFSDETLTRVISTNDDYDTILGIVWHIASAETYWFFKSGHSIGPRFDRGDIAVVLKKLDENTERIVEVLNTCDLEQLRIVPPSPEGGPSIAWALLRTYMHGVYHTGQIAKIRRMIGAPELPSETGNSWSVAVDSVANIVHGLLDDELKS
jgi:uncharacterized damage-inducible protein DinB